MGPRTLEYGRRGDRLGEERYWVGDGRNLIRSGGCSCCPRSEEAVELGYQE